MRQSTCSRKARERVKAHTRWKLARHSNFACSICGNIPIVFHHIEEWSKRFSNDERFLIPICDKCHRRVHGEGGSVFSKDDLYEFKATPKRPSILKDKFPLEQKRGYSFFVGSNFIADGEKASLFRFPDGHCLVSIDTSPGILRLSILAGIQNGEAVYLIKDNELLIDSQDVWDMKYSGSSLKIWKIANGKEVVFIDLIIKPDVIIIRRMNTSFNGITFRVRKLRAPQQRQVRKIVAGVKHHEELYHEMSAEIDKQPRIGYVVNGVDIDTLIKQLRKDDLRMRLEQDLRYGFCKQFRWDWRYYQGVLNRVLRESPIFGRDRDVPPNLPAELRRMHEAAATIKAKYREEFEELSDVVAEFGGVIWLGNFEV